MCVSESGLELEPVDSDKAVSPGLIEVGSFDSLERAKQEIESIAKAIDEQSRIYRIKKK